MIARFRLSPLTNGNGWAGSTASGVSTGNTCSWKYVDSSALLGVVEVGPVDDDDALVGQRRPHRVEEHPSVAAGELLGAFADAAQLFAR